MLVYIAKSLQKHPTVINGKGSKGQSQPAKGWQYRQATTTPGKTDTSRWIHPYKLGDKGTITPKGQKQPEVGWTYAQAPTDFSKYIHPYSGQTIDVPKAKKGDDFKIGDKIADFDDERALAPGKSKAQPEYGWEISNIPKIGEKIPEAPKTLSQKDLSKREVWARSHSQGPGPGTGRGGGLPF